MSQYYIVSETTEDTFDAADDLQDAIRIAKELAQEGQVGESVCIELEGMIVGQFVLMPDGKVAEEAIASRLLSEASIDPTHRS